MIKSFLNGVIGGFSRTLGRILFYIFVALIFYFIFGMKNVDALEQTGTFQMTTPYDSPCGSGANGYCAIQTNQSVYTRSLNTTYNGVLQCINFEVNYTFNSNYQYNLYLEGMSTDFRNNSLTHYVYGYHNSPSQVDSISTTLKFISKSKLQISFPKGIFYAHYPVTICGSPLTGISNYGIKKAYLKYDDGQQDIGGVIENNNTNTQNIIENNNSNTQDIIDNQNQNTQDLISNQTCPLGPLSITRDEWGTNRGYVLGSDGSLVSMSGNDISPYFLVKPNTQYTLTTTGGAINSNLHYCFYNSNKTLINCSSYNSGNSADNVFTTTQYVQYLRISIQGSRTFTLTGPVCNNWELEKQNQMVNTQKATNDLLTNQTPMDSTIFSTWWTNFTENQFSNPLGNLITLPINLVQKLINYSSTACQPVQLGSLLGTNLTLTCFTLGDIITNSVVLNVLDLIMSLSLIVFTLKKSYETVSNLISLGGENEVKKHFKFPTPMEFIATLFGGGN